VCSLGERRVREEVDMKGWRRLAGEEGGKDKSRENDGNGRRGGGQANL